MTWTSPVTFVAGSTLTAAMLNTYVRDNLNEMDAAKATTAGGYFITTGANAIVERFSGTATVATAQGTASTSYVDLATVGPTVTLTTGRQALIFVAAQMTGNGAGAQGLVSFAVSGATTVSASESHAAQHRAGNVTGPVERLGAFTWLDLIEGSNTFTAKYRAVSGTITYSNRHMWVMAL